MGRVGTAWGTTVLIALLAAACGSAGVATGTGAGNRATGPSAAPTGVSPPRPIRVNGSTTTATPPTVPPEQPGWTVVNVDGTGVAVDQRTLAFGDGGIVTVARFHVGRSRFVLHVGSQDPPTFGARIHASAGPAVSGAELPRLLAAFNGGFKISSGSGGFELDGTVLRTLTFGTASFVIDTNGSGHVGVWGQDLPRPGEHIASVRQNLPPLVRNGQLNPDLSQIQAWGATFKGESAVARSALGQDAHGDILYAAGMSILPIDLGRALIAAGATTAMQLDINPEWVQLALSPRPGGPLFPGVPGQHRPANQYILGWTRDFITVLAANSR